MFYRGGVLEPSGTCEIKYKMKDLVRTMKRIDEQYCTLSASLAAPGNNFHNSTSFSVTI